MRATLIDALLGVVVGVLVTAGPAAAADSTPFPDVPPWHWAFDAVIKDQGAGLLIGYPAAPAELGRNSIAQVYDGFVHAGAEGAQAWVERFSYNRPATWPAPLQRSEIAQFTLNGLRLSARDDTATATFTATVTTRQGRAVTTPMRVALRFNGQDWQVDYAGLASGSLFFR